MLPRLAREHGVRLLEVTPTDESLESVFAYLVVARERAAISPTIVRLGARSVFGRRRGVLLFVLPLVLVALAVLVRGARRGGRRRRAEHTSTASGSS